MAKFSNTLESGSPNKQCSINTTEKIFFTRTLFLVALYNFSPISVCKDCKANEIRYCFLEVFNLLSKSGRKSTRE